MRPEKFNNLMNRAIREWLETGGNGRFLSLLPEIERRWEERANYEGDVRGGQETYGYADVYSRMEYISDRWDCAFRLRWIIDGLENGAI